MDKHKVNNNQLDFKLGQFTQDKLDVRLTKIKKQESCRSWWNTTRGMENRKFDNLLFQYCNAVYNQNTIDGWTKGCILPFPKKGDLRIAKNYRGINLTSIAAKIYNALIVSHIESEIEKIPRKNQDVFRQNRFSTSEILRIRQIIGIRTKNWRRHTYS